MHELTLVRNLLQLIDEHINSQQQVDGIHLEVGMLSCVDDQALTFCFEAAAKNTAASNAKLFIHHEPGEGYCQHCQQSCTIEQRYQPCPHCQQCGLTITAGDSITLQSIEVSPCAEHAAASK